MKNRENSVWFLKKLTKRFNILLELKISAFKTEIKLGSKKRKWLDEKTYLPPSCHNIIILTFIPQALTSSRCRTTNYSSTVDIEFVSKTQNIRITGGETPTSAGQVSDVGNAVPLSVVDGEVREELVPGILHDVPREQLGAGIFLQRHKEIVE